MTASNAVDCCMVCDSGYVDQTIVTISSFFATKNTTSAYRFHVIAVDLPEERREQLLSLSSAGAEVLVLPSSATSLGGVGMTRDAMTQATQAALFKFQIPNLFPDLDKILYLDGDVIGRIDLHELYDISLGDCYAAAVADSGTLYYSASGTPDVSFYFNSGVMLLNLALLRRDCIPEKLIEAKKKRLDLGLMDQNIFNLVFNGRVHPLPIRYNFMPVNLYRSYAAWNIDDVNAKYGTTYSTKRELFDDAAIVHYSSKDKPWKNPDGPFSFLWRKYWFQSGLGVLPENGRPPRRPGQPLVSVVPEGTGSVLNQVTGLYVVFAKGGDQVIPDVLEELAERAERDNLDLVLFNGVFREDSPDASSAWQPMVRGTNVYPGIWQGKKLYAALFNGKEACPDSSLVLVRSDLLRTMPQLLPDGTPFAEDKYYVEALFLAARCACFTETAVRCRRTAHSPKADESGEDALSSGRSAFVAFMVWKMRRHDGNAPLVEALLTHLSTRVDPQTVNTRVLPFLMRDKHPSPQPIMKTSIIVPVYNTAPYLPRCLKSLIGQTLSDIEIICIDDGSTDGSADIIRQFAAKDKRIIPIFGENHGVEYSRALAMEKASGTYIMFCDSDDEYVPCMCEKMVGAIERDKVDWAICGARHVGAFTKHEIAHRKKISAKRVPVSEVARDDVLWNKIFKKELIDKSGLAFPKDSGIRRGFDSVFCFCYSLVAERATVLSDELYVYYRRPGSLQMRRRGKQLATTIDAIRSMPGVISFMDWNGLWKANRDRYLKWAESVVCETFKMGAPSERKEGLRLLEDELRPRRHDIGPATPFLFSVAYRDSMFLKDFFAGLDSKAEKESSPACGRGGGGTVGKRPPLLAVLRHLVRRMPIFGPHLVYCDRLQKECEKQKAEIERLDRKLRERTKLSKRYSHRMIHAEKSLREILLEEALFSSERHERGTSGNSPDRDGAVVVSFTSYPARMNLAAMAAQSLLRQSFKPDAVVLWLDKDQFPGGRAELPDVFTSLEQRGLTIQWCQGGLRSFKKLVPALSQYPRANLVTADDDIFYPLDWLAKLVEAHRENPGEIPAFRCRRILFDEVGRPLPYKKWPLNDSSFLSVPSTANLFTTGGGALFPPGSLHADAVDIAKIQDLAPDADDLWFWACAAMLGTTVRWIDSPESEIQDLDSREVFGSETLASANLHNGGNDRQFAAILDAYPIIRERLGIPFPYGRDAWENYLQMK